MHTPVRYVQEIGDIPFTKECIVIADERLPERILRTLPDPILVHPGEPLKSLASIEHLAETVLARRASKPLTLVSAGGGSVGDAVGFLASILWRGVGLWHVPTTLLAMIDSAHGGKTAVNLPQAKNQLGTFYPAHQIFIVSDIIATLPMRVRREGLSELLKTFILPNEEPFEHLPSFEDLAFAPWEEIGERLLRLIKTAITIKMSIVDQDPYEQSGMRSLLNLGHTLGHALERTAGLSHGTAVAWGLAATLEVSREHGLSEDAAAMAASQLYPLLTPLPPGIDTAALVQAMHRDKKRNDNRLRSIVLENLRRAKITEQVNEQTWLDALARAKEAFESRPVTVSAGQPRSVSLEIAASKSELIRGLAIAALRPGATVIHGVNDAGDVHAMYRALRLMGFAIEQTPDGYRSLRTADPVIPEHIPAIRCGEGAAPFRFLLAIAATLQRETILLAEPQLLGRPHDSLIQPLREAGATIEPYRSEAGLGYRVRGWEKHPKKFTIDVGLSSQYASALALLAAGTDAPFTIRMEGDIVSEPYLRMTLDMLARAGVEIIQQDRLIAMNPTDALDAPLELTAEADASSAAVWRTMQFLGYPVELANGTNGKSSQPDARAATLLASIQSASEGATIDLTDTPDLLPVLTVAALRKGVPVHFTGIGRLRHKESNRFEGFAESLRAIGVPMELTPDGLRTPRSEDVTFTPGAVFRTYGDHRLVMAGTLLGLILGPLQIDAPWSVAKSYPEFWNHAREAGVRMQVALQNGK